MKTKLFATLCAMAVVLMSVGCVPDSGQEQTVPTLEVSPALLELDCAAQTNCVGVECNGDWVATTTADWITLDVSSGSGSGIIDFAVAENNGTEAREAQIDVVSGELTACCIITQSTATFRVDVKSVEFTYEGASQSIDVFSVNTWSAETDAEWLTLDYEPKAGEIRPLTITAEANNTLQSRSAEIEIRTKGESATIKVTQAKMSSTNFILMFDTEAYNAETETITTDIFGATYKMVVGAPSSSVIWDATVDYVGVEPFIETANNLAQTGDGEVTFTLPFNNSGAPRTGVMTVKGKYKGETITRTVTFEQSYFEANFAESFELTGDVEDIDLGLTISPALDVVYTTDAEWIKGENGKYSVDANASMEARSGSITMTLAKDSTVVVGVVPVSQPRLYTVAIPFQCNTYVTPQDPTIKSSPSFHNRIIQDLSVQPDGSKKLGGTMLSQRAWMTSQIKTPHQLSFFFRTEHTGPINFGMETLLAWDKEAIADTAYLEIEIGEERIKTMITNNRLHYHHVGTFNIKEPGYIRVNIIPIEATGRYLPYISNFLVGGEGINNAVNKRKGDITYVTYEETQRSDPHWIRRGPSGNLGYPQPANTEWFYNEIYVEKGYDISGSYYMTTGGSAFYMGLQPSDNGRVVLFSAWDTDTDLGWHAEVVRYGKNKPNSFGHEGSGKQTFLKYEWEAEKTYATLVHVRPEVDADGKQTGSTLYTGYFWSEADGWQLVAEYRRPHEVVYYRGAHSFCETFSPDRGWIPRKVNFTNQWMRDKDGVWHEVLEAQLGVDGTGGEGMRKDFAGGVDKERNCFYLTNIGYINEWMKPGTKFRREPSGNNPPDIPFDELAKMGTWYEAK